ncbi:hypothetical protein [Saccharopolyspora sp. NPDC002578]
MREHARIEDEIPSHAGRVIDAEKHETTQRLVYSPVTAGSVLALQRAVGNAAVAKELEDHTARRTARTTQESRPGIERHGESSYHSVQRMTQRAFGTWTMKQSTAGDHASNDFLAYVYAQRADRGKRWQSNFAVLEYVDNDDAGQHKYLDSFNLGNYSLHSEEVIFWQLSKMDYRPVALFSDRKPCEGGKGSCMGQTIGPAITARAAGYDVPIYFATDYPPANQTEIKNWWE